MEMPLSDITEVPKPAHYKLSRYTAGNRLKN